MLRVYKQGGAETAALPGLAYSMYSMRAGVCALCFRFFSYLDDVPVSGAVLSPLCSSTQGTCDVSDVSRDLKALFGEVKTCWPPENK